MSSSVLGLQKSLDGWPIATTAKENGARVDLGGKRKKKGVCGEGGREEFELLGS